MLIMNVSQQQHYILFWQEPDAPSSKVVRESHKYTPQATFGFRIVGMRVCNSSSVRTFPKSFGRSLTTHDAVKNAFRTFLEPASDRCLSNLLVQIRPIVRWFEENDSLLFCASSILLVYEGAHDSVPSDVASVKMIDFGRVRHRVGGDPGYRHGLSTLQGILTELQREVKSTASGSRKVPC